MRDIKSVKAYDRYPEASEKFCAEMSRSLGLEGVTPGTVPAHEFACRVASTI